MPLSLRRGTVSAVVERHEELVRLEVDDVPCIAYPRLTGPVELGDEVLVNVQARELELGSGGFDVLYANLTRGLELDAGARRTRDRLPYTPLQHARMPCRGAGRAAASLDGMPVVCCSLHSQVAPVCAALKGLRVAYVQLAGGALPVSLSDTLRALEGARPSRRDSRRGAVLRRRRAMRHDHVGAGVGARGARRAVCAIGPGIVGTGTRLGHGGLASADAVNAASALGGRPIVAVRASEADERDRHRGVSHHTAAVLSLTYDEPLVGGTSADGWREACAGLPLSHMGRGPDDDPAFFEAAFAAGLLARSLVA